MSNALLTMPAVAADDGIEADHHNNVAANVRSLSRNFWDAGTPDLALSEQKQGASWMDPTTLAMWIFRIDGAGDPRDAGSPLRPTWHWNDFDGAPPSDGRVAEGDCLIWDSGSGDTYVLHRDAGRFRGLGVLAEYRTAATSGVPAQPSEPILIRSSEWVSGAAKWRQVRMRYVQGALQFLYETEEGASHLAFTLSHGSSSTFELWGNPTGNVVPGLKYSRDRTGSSPGQISCTFSTEQTDIDGTAVWFQHGDNTRFARHRFRGSDAGDLGAAAEVLSASYRLPATALATTRNSASVGYVGSYWDGAVGVEAIAYAQHILTSTDPAGYLRHGFGYGVGTLDFYSDGGVRITQDPAGSSSPAGQLQLNTSVAATSGAKTSPGGAFVSIGYSWDGAASQPRVMGWYTNVDDPADATDVWSMRLVAVGSGSADVLYATSTGWLGIGATPAVAAHVTETTTITGGVTDGYTASLRLSPTYTAATAQTVTRHNYIDIPDVVATGAGPAAVTTACVLRLDAALGTHKATTNADKTGNAKSGTLVVNVNGTLYDIQLYAH